MRTTTSFASRLSRAPLGVAAVLSLGVLTGASAARADDIAFVEASSELDEGKPATSMWNAVDGKDTTMWCSGGGGAAQNAFLSFGFEKSETVTHIGIVVAPQKGESIDKTNKRARIVYVADLEHRVEAKFRDDAGMQVLELTPPAKGKRVVVEVAGVYDGATPESPVCIAEVVLKHKTKEMTGASIATKLRALNTPSKRLLHEWVDDPSAPTRTLVLNVDGTFSYKYEPVLEGKPAKLKGKWTANDRAIVFDILGKAVRVEARLTKIDEGDEHTIELVLSGDPPHPSMAATYRPAPKRMP